MKTITVANEGWFKSASFSDVETVGVKFLGIPAEKFSGKQPEHFKRAMVRQVFVKTHSYGESFEIHENANPFGTPKKRRGPKSRKSLRTGHYTFIKNGLRAPEGDIRREMMELVGEHTDFESLFKAGSDKYGLATKFKSTGKLEFDFVGLVDWAVQRGWIGLGKE